MLGMVSADARVSLCQSQCFQACCARCFYLDSGLAWVQELDTVLGQLGLQQTQVVLRG